jgi:hypothetical protein
MKTDDNAATLAARVRELERDQVLMLQRLQALEHCLVDPALAWFGTERDKAWDYGRKAAAASLAGVIDFLESIGRFKRDRLTEPLEQLFVALLQVEQGRKHPMLTPAKQGHRTKDDLFQATLKGRAAAAMTSWMESRKPEEEAGKIVAEALREAGCKLRSARSNRSVEWTTVASWRDKVTGNSDASDARRAYRSILRLVESRSLSWEERAKVLTADLQSFVHKLGLYEI